MLNNVGWNRFNTSYRIPTQQPPAAQSAKKNSKIGISQACRHQHPSHPTSAVNMLQRIQQIYSSLRELSSVAQAQNQQRKESGQGVLETIRQVPKDTAAAMQILAEFASYGQQHASAQQQAASAAASPLNMIGSMAQKYTLGQLEQQTLQALAAELNIPIGNLSMEAGLESIITEVVGDDIASSLGLGVETGTGSSTASGAASSGLGSTFSTVIGAAGAAYSAYNLINNFGQYDLMSGAVNGAAIGAQLGSFIPGIGTFIGGAIGGIVGGISSFFGGSGKSKEQKSRDAVRDYLQENGIIDQDWALSLADGSRYSIGIDGKNKYQNYDGTMRHPYDVDFSHPLAAQTTAWANPIFEILLGDQPDLNSQFVGYFVNAALSNAPDLETARQNLITMLSKFEISPEEILQGLVSKAEQGLMDEQTLMVHVNNVQTLLVPTNFDAGLPNQQLENASLILMNQIEAYTDRGERYFYGVVNDADTSENPETVLLETEQEELILEEAA